MQGQGLLTIRRINCSILLKQKGIYQFIVQFNFVYGRYLKNAGVSRSKMYLENTWELRAFYLNIFNTKIFDTFWFFSHPTHADSKQILNQFK